MSFALFQRPGTVVFLDDDPDYLETLALVLPRQWHAKFFLRPAECISHLQQEPPFWEADAWNQQRLIDQWHDGKSLIPQILDYWSRYTERYALSRVCVFDYSMPGMDGLQALAELTEWSGARVLLTGQADEQIAVNAFNRGLIGQFIAKQTPDISRRLIDTVRQLLQAPNERHAQIWRATLSPEQSALLRLGPVHRDLAALAASLWVEYVVIGEPFGVLGMDARGQVSWLQLETPDGLKALAELAELEGIAPAGLADIRDGRKLVDFELRQALSLVQPCRWEPAFSVGDGGVAVGAVFTIDPALCPPLANSFSQWLARQEARHVRG